MITKGNRITISMETFISPLHDTKPPNKLNINSAKMYNIKHQNVHILVKRKKKEVKTKHVN